MQNILVVKLSAIGDVIHALPVSYAIKETFPEAHLTWVVEPPGL
jgi:heptosyltransferase-1